MTSTKTLHLSTLSDAIGSDLAIEKEKAEQLFSFFCTHPLFRWTDANNDCEDRANAICILLDEWNVPNCKGWVFSGYVFRKKGYLKHLWKYHVAAAVQVQQENEIQTFIIDPATTTGIMTVDAWAENVTDNPHSYYLVKHGGVYIFPSRKIEKDNWYYRNKRNFNWTIQGLSGINGLSSTGKAQLRFNKKKLLQTRRLFNDLRNSRPSFL
jgi:hypothetical protein